MRLQPTILPDISPNLVAEYGGAVRAAFAHAEQVAGHVHERVFGIAGGTVRVRGLGDTLFARMTEALAHLPALPRMASGAPADLTIHLWDSPGDSWTSPPSPLAWYNRQQPAGTVMEFETAQFDARGELPGFNTPRIRTAFHLWPHVLHLLDRNAGEGYFWIERAEQLPYYELATPFRKILSWWVSARGWLFAHAGAVGTAAGGVLLVGPAGAGKSTSSLACVGSPLGYAGDDCCLVSAGPRARVYSLYNSAKLKGGADLERFPHLASLVRNPDRLGFEKALLFLHREFPQHLVREFPLRALVVPKVVGGSGARLVPITAAVALATMAPNTCIQFPGSGRIALGLMAGLVRQLPCYALEVGPEVSAIPTALRALLSGESEPSGAR